MCKLFNAFVAAVVVVCPGIALASGKKSGPATFTPRSISLPKLPLVKNPTIISTPRTLIAPVTIGLPKTTQTWARVRWLGLDAFRVWDARRGCFLYRLLGRPGCFLDVGGRMVPVETPGGLPPLPEGGPMTCPTGPTGPTGPMTPMDPITLPPTDPITLPPMTTPMDPAPADPMPMEPIPMPRGEPATPPDGDGESGTPAPDDK